MTNPGVTRILVTSSQLMELLQRQPEVEIELIRNAVPQIATLLAQKAKLTSSDISIKVAEAWREMERTHKDRYGIPDRVREIIRSFLADECRTEARALLAAEARAEAKKIAEGAVNAALLRLGQDLEKAVARSKAEVDEYIKETAEREVLALLRAGKLTVVS